MERASFGRRFAALFADWSISYFVAVFLSKFHLGSVSALQYLVFFLEVVLFTTIGQASIGQKLLNLRIVRESDSGYVSFGNVVLRTILLILVIPALITTNGRGLHDLAAKSKIVRVISA
jgi:uncharacterized RDD family membrane protein YckC